MENIITDLCLKFASEDEARSVLFSEDAANYRYLDLIGTIYAPTGKMLQTDEGEWPEMAPVDGWHVNVRVLPDEDMAALEQFVVTPTTPVRVWA